MAEVYLRGRRILEIAICPCGTVFAIPHEEADMFAHEAVCSENGDRNYHGELPGTLVGTADLPYVVGGPLR